MQGVSGTATNLFKVFSSDLRQRLIPLLWEAWAAKSNQLRRVVTLAKATLCYKVIIGPDSWT